MHHRLVVMIIGVVTAVQAVHLSRIGTLREVERAKGELLEALPPDGTAVLNADDPIVTRMDSRTVAHAVRYGFDASNLETVRGLTIVPAVTAGIDDRLGSLEAGKDADFVVLTGDPADPRTSIEKVFIDGKRVYDTAKDKRRF